MGWSDNTKTQNEEQKEEIRERGDGLRMIGLGGVGRLGLGVGVRNGNKGLQRRRKESWILGTLDEEIKCHTLSGVIGYMLCSTDGQKLTSRIQ
ncbi:hypothetical protein RND71_035506 [Anisodus tanguticus]|uniref:Uncharacterized protein n=1 Tax=Anisodus tanguticus TaxID=243964 RepID=A0AAE1R522_9SOLA|nr:hypothetical protein RND71_035506 [Anisodus tanguticus]